MTWLLVCVTAFGAELVVDAKVPVELYVSGALVAQLAVPAELHVQVEAGPNHLKVFTDGKPSELEVDVDVDRGARVVIGRTGITTEAPGEKAPAAEGPRAVEVRSVAHEDLLVVVADQRYKVAPGDRLALELDPGDHRLSVRAGNGTVVYAAGTLRVGDAALVIQVSEGRVPEVAGAGGSYRPDVR